MDVQVIIKIIAIVLALMVSIIGHEIMHGYVAYKYGDATAKNSNRLTINPLPHIDILGTIILPAILFFTGAPFLFGWAKPVPINMRTVISNGGYNAAIAVSLAGIFYNFILATISVIILKIFNFQVDSYLTLFLAQLLLYMVIYNIVLGYFNLLPIPPLDGSNALLYIFLKFKVTKAAMFILNMQKYGMVVLLLVLITPLSSVFFAIPNMLIRLIIR